MAENRSSTSMGWRWSRIAMLAGVVAAAALVCGNASPAFAQGREGGGSTYQRKGPYAGHGRGHHGDWRHRPMPQFSSKVSASSFQRPYPYHLDYYRMKYGGSYAPYFGNLYGPPIYNFFGTPFLGGYSPNFAFGGFPGSGFDGYGYGPAGGFGGPGGVPYGPWAGEVEVPAGPVIERPVVEGAVVE